MFLFLFFSSNLEETINEPLTPPKHESATHTGINQPAHSGNIFVATSYKGTVNSNNR